jgi:ribose transport system permease protein
MTGIVATAMTLVIIGGNLDLSVASNMALTSVIVANLLMFFHWNQPLAVLAGLVLGILLGMFNAVLIARVGINAVIVTLASFNMFRNGAYLMGNKGGQAIPIAFADPNSFFNFIGQGDVAGVPTPLILMIVVFLAIWFLLDRTRFGREIYAVGGNQRAAHFSGISVSNYTFLIFVLTGFVSAISGVIYASRLAGGYPMAAQGWELDIITAVFLGGTSLAGGEGSIVGTLIGVLILGVLRSGLSLAGIETSAQYMVTGAVLLIAVLYDSIRRRREAV